jgi:SAM-dependent methyltransferase
MASIVVGLIVIIAFFILHYGSYHHIKRKVLKSQKWDLNICCGLTDGGGLNVDIVQHSAVPSFQLITDIYRLPFKDKAFNSVLSSHTIEHVDDPQRFYSELTRIGKKVTLVVPPLWDLAAVFNILEHRWIFFTFSKIHRNNLPPYVGLPFAKRIQKSIGQKIHA